MSEIDLGVRRRKPSPKVEDGRGRCPTWHGNEHDVPMTIGSKARQECIFPPIKCSEPTYPSLICTFFLYKNKIKYLFFVFCFCVNSTSTV